MSKPYDAALKQLLDKYAVDWAVYLAARLGLPPGPVEPIDSDLSTSLQADKLLRLGPPAAGVLHLELQSGWDDGVPDRVVWYNSLADHRHGPPVHSVVILLRPEANASNLTGHLQRVGADGKAYLDFRYAVIRLWQEPLAPLLEGGIGLLPLAPLTDAARPDLPGVLRRFEERLRQANATPEVVQSLRGASFVLLGLRYEHDFIEKLYQGVTGMEESTTYQLIFGRGKAEGTALGRAEGEARAFRESLLIAGEARFGAAESAARDGLNAITDHDRLRRMLQRLPHAADWNDLLATP